MCAVFSAGLHWDHTARAQDSHLPHWVATPISSWTSSKAMPLRAARAMWWSLTRWQTQMIMLGFLGWVARMIMDVIHMRKCIEKTS